MSKQTKLALIKKFDENDLHILAMDYGMDMEGVVGKQGGADVHYVFDLGGWKGKIAYWPSTDILHIHKKNLYHKPGLNKLYKFAKNLKK